MKTNVFIALGLVATAKANHHRHHQRSKVAVKQHLQQEIEQLREAYSNLAEDYEGLEQYTKKLQSSLAQGPAPFGNAGGAGKGPAYPSPQPFVRGEKQWMDNAQNIGDWGESQMDVANARIPYQSTAQAEGPFGNAGGAGKGPTLPSPQPFVRGEKQWMNNAQNIGDWGESQMDVANARIPYMSTAQTEGPYGNAGGAGKGPTLPSPQPFVRGEKQWMDNAQNIGDWGENQMTVANTRIPYQSTAQTEGPAPFGIATEAGHLGGPAYPSPQPFVRGEKQWMDNAQNIGDWGENQMTVANTRIPYMSTAQLEGVAPYGIATESGHLGGPAYPSPQPFVRGEKQWMDNAQNIGDWGENQMTVANTRIPYMSTVQLEGPAPFGIATEAGHLGGPAYPSPQPFVRGEKQWMDNAQNIGDWGENQMTVANARIPYASTLVQTKDDDADSKDPELSILYEQDKPDNKPEKVALVGNKIPLNYDFEFVQTKDDDPKKMEGMMMEDPNIPLNLRLLQTNNDDVEGMESMVMEEMDLPLNARLIHIKTEGGNELIKIVN